VAANQSAIAAILSDQDVYDDGILHIEHHSYYVTCKGTPILLPRKEFLLLSRLARNIGRIVPMQVLWNHVWEGEPFNPVTLRVYVSHLRKKLVPFGVHIKTLISVGYFLCLPQRGSGDHAG
jgi:DNA-binding response OmpR family regulator